MVYFKRWAARAALGLAVAGLGGCASFEFTKPAPAQQQPIAVKLSGEDLSGWSDLPIGTYRVPDSQVIVSGHQKGAGAGMLFGLVGVAIAHAANANAGGQTVKDVEDTLRIKLNDQITAAVGQVISSQSLGSKFTQTEAAGATTMLLTPGVVLSFVSETDVRPFVVLKASLQGADKKPLWTTRYMASTGAAKPLTGEGSWTDQNGAALKVAIQASLDQAVRVMLTDVSQPYKRDDAALTVVQGNFPYVKPRLQIVGYKLAEDDRYVTFIPKLGDVLVFAGVNVLDKNVTVVRTATKEDAVFKTIDDTPVKKQ